VVQPPPGGVVVAVIVTVALHCTLCVPFETVAVYVVFVVGCTIVVPIAVVNVPPPLSIVIEVALLVCHVSVTASPELIVVGVAVSEIHAATVGGGVQLLVQPPGGVVVGGVTTTGVVPTGVVTTGVVTTVDGVVTSTWQQGWVP
jgi:hypothetical protein